MTTRDLSKYRKLTTGGSRSAVNMPREFPRGAVNDLFPLTSVPDRVVARTVFTAYKIPQRSAADPYAPPLHAAVCACGDTWRTDSEAFLRKTLGEHSCADQRGRPIELVPIDGDPDDELLARVLSGLRELP